MAPRVGQTKREYALERIKEGVDNGTYPPGSRMPFNSELAATFGVSEGTLSNALWDAQRAGYMQDKPGINSPWYVADEAEVIEFKNALSHAEAVLGQLEDQLGSLGTQLDELVLQFDLVSDAHESASEVLTEAKKCLTKVRAAAAFKEQQA